MALKNRVLHVPLKLVILSALSTSAFLLPSSWSQPENLTSKISSSANHVLPANGSFTVSKPTAFNDSDLFSVLNPTDSNVLTRQNTSTSILPELMQAIRDFELLFGSRGNLSSSFGPANQRGTRNKLRRQNFMVDVGVMSHQPVAAPWWEALQEKIPIWQEHYDQFPIKEMIERRLKELIEYSDDWKETVEKDGRCLIDCQQASEVRARTMESWNEEIVKHSREKIFTEKCPDWEVADGRLEFGPKYFIAKDEQFVNNIGVLSRTPYRRSTVLKKCNRRCRHAEWLKRFLAIAYIVRVDTQVREQTKWMICPPSPVRTFLRVSLMSVPVTIVEKVKVTATTVKRVCVPVTTEKKEVVTLFCGRCWVDPITTFLFKRQQALATSSDAASAAKTSDNNGLDTNTSGDILIITSTITVTGNCSQAGPVTEPIPATTSAIVSNSVSNRLRYRRSPNHVQARETAIASAPRQQNETFLEDVSDAYGNRQNESIPDQIPLNETVGDPDAPVEKKDSSAPGCHYVNSDGQCVYIGIVDRFMHFAANVWWHIWGFLGHIWDYLGFIIVFAIFLLVVLMFCGLSCTCLVGIREFVAGQMPKRRISRESEQSSMELPTVRVSPPVFENSQESDSSQGVATPPDSDPAGESCPNLQSANGPTYRPVPSSD